MPPQEPQTPAQPAPQAAPVQPPAQPTQPPSASQAAYNIVTPPKKRIPKWLLIVGGIIVALAAVLAVVFVVVTNATEAPRKVSDQFVNDIQSSNTGAAYALTSKAFQQATTEEQLDQLVKKVGPALQGEETISGRVIKKSTAGVPSAALVYSVKTTNGTKYMKVVLQEVDNVWQVVNFRSSDQAIDATIE